MKRALPTSLIDIAVGVTALANPAAAAPNPTQADRAILKAGVIVAADVPSDWAAEKQSDTASKDFRGVAECAQIRRVLASAKRSVSRALSKAFTQPDAQGGALAENVVYAFKSTRAANAFVTAFKGADAPACLEKGLGRALETQTSVSPIETLQGVGDDSAGYEAVAPVTNEGQTFDIYLDLITIRVGRAVLAYEFINPNEQIVQGPDIVNAGLNRVAPLSQ